MPTKPPHHVPSQESQNSHPPKFTPTRRGSVGTQLCETNPIPPLSAAKSRFIGEPNFRPTPHPPSLPKRELCKTNPIYPCRHPLAGFPIPEYAKRTQFRAPHVSAHPTFHETNPISPPGRKSPVRARHAVPQMRKTNPIPAPRPHYSPFTAHYSLFLQNEPNSRIPSVPPPHIFTKQTQSHR